MASVLKCPVVFICNNNQYAYSTPLERQMAVENVADRAPAYGMPGEIVDGNDVLAVWNASQRAIEYARGGNGPSLIECKTFRMTGHSAHDDASYVPRELFEYWETRDPIRRLERTLIQQNILSDAGIAEMNKGIHAEIDEAIAIAEKDPYPEPEDCLRDVYFEEQ
jgi:pyruvate dehydrogenase E1 component alpha subunit